MAERFEIPGRWFDKLTIRPDRPFDRLRDRSSRLGMALMEQVPFGLGAGSPTSWRRWPQFLEQVWKKSVDLRHWRAWEADLRRRYPGKNLTCAKMGVDLRRTWAGPFDKLRDRSAGAGAGGSTGSPSGPTGRFDRLSARLPFLLHL